MVPGVPEGDTARKRLYDLLTREGQFDAVAEEALELGCTYLGVAHAHVARTDAAVDRWEVVASTCDETCSYPEGTTADLGATFCRHTLQAESSLAIHDAAAAGYGDDPAYERHGLRCYHGTPLTVDGETYGTLCFVDEDARPPFDPEETSFAELVARLLERELEREGRARELQRRETLITVLSRVLRHNLRNDMTVIRGQVSTLADRLEAASERCETVIELSDNIIEMSEKARTLERIVSSQFEREPVDVVSLVEQVVQEAVSEYPTASVTIRGDSPVTLTALPSLEMAIAEVVENAVEHAGPDPTVSVRVDDADESVSLSVADDGPGLPEHERAVLDEGVETPLVHGSGLGLWMVYWVVTTHGGSVETTVDDVGTTVTLTVPRSGAIGEDRTLTERRFQRGYDRFRAVFEGAFDAMVVVDDDRRIVDANGRAAELFGVSAEDLLGRSLDSFAPVEEVAPRWPTSDRVDQDIVRVRDEDGDEHLVEFTVSQNVVPGQHLVVGREVTQRFARERRLEALREGFPHLCFVLDEAGVYREVLASPATEDKLYDDADRLLGESVRDVLPEEPARRVLDAIETTIETGEPTQVTYTLEVPAGERRFEGRTHPLSVPFESGDAVSLVVRDVTDRPETRAHGR